MMKANSVELDYVIQTLSNLEAIGLRRDETFDVSMQTYADAVIEGYPATDASRNECNRIMQCAPYPRLAVIWNIEIEETGESLAYFRNVLMFRDHCFDVAVIEDYERLLEEIISTASDDWNPGLVRTQERTGFFSSPKVQLAVESNGKRHPVSIGGGKDFDVNLVAQLNALIPSTIDARFACCGDGGAVMVVWLTPDKIAALGEFCGFAFDIPS